MALASAKVLPAYPLNAICGGFKPNCAPVCPPRSGDLSSKCVKLNVSGPLDPLLYQGLSFGGSP